MRLPKICIPEYGEPATRGIRRLASTAYHTGKPVRPKAKKRQKKHEKKNFINIQIICNPPCVSSRQFEYLSSRSLSLFFEVVFSSNRNSLSVSKLYKDFHSGINDQTESGQVQMVIIFIIFLLLHLAVKAFWFFIEFLAANEMHAEAQVGNFPLLPGLETVLSRKII